MKSEASVARCACAARRTGVTECASICTGRGAGHSRETCPGCRHRWQPINRREIPFLQSVHGPGGVLVLTLSPPSLRQACQPAGRDKRAVLPRHHGNNLNFNVVREYSQWKTTRLNIKERLIVQLYTELSGVFLLTATQSTNHNN